MVLKAITNRIANHKIFIKLAGRTSKIPGVKVNYDAATKLIVDGIGVNKDLQFVTGLINFQTGQMHLIDSVSHETFAAKKGLLKDINTLMDGWYGLRLFCEYGSDINSMLLTIAPESTKFKGIPIEYSSAFECHMNDLFGNKANKILFRQMRYERGFTEDKQRFWITILDSMKMLDVPKSMSNKELSKWLTKSRLM
jgi:hypothetical protein